MIRFDESHNIWLDLNWMGRYVTIPLFMLGAREQWRPL